MWCKKKRKRKLFSDVCSACREYSFSTLSANKSRVSRVVNPSCHRHIIHIADTRTSCYDRHQKTVNAKRGPPRKFHAVFPLIREAPQLFLLPTRHQKPFPRCIQLSLSFLYLSLFRRMRLSAYYYYGSSSTHAKDTRTDWSDDTLYYSFYFFHSKHIV